MNTQNFHSQKSFGSVSNLTMVLPSEMMYFSSDNAVNQSVYLPRPLFSQILKRAHIFDRACYKLYSSCKFFFSQLRILPVTFLITKQYVIRFSNVHINQTYVEFEASHADNLNFKFYVCHQLNIKEHWINNSPPPRFVLSKLIPKIVPSNVKSLLLRKQFLTLDEFTMFCCEVEFLEMVGVTVEDSNGAIVPVEDLLKLTPELRFFDL